eukprot:663258-Ditylum_brightwellii.AAC.1
MITSLLVSIISIPSATTAVRSSPTAAHFSLQKSGRERLIDQTVSKGTNQKCFCKIIQHKERKSLPL